MAYDRKCYDFQSEFFRFHNGLRILLNIDAAEFPGPTEDWSRFRDSPHRYFIECSDDVAAGLWQIIAKRTQKVRDA